MRRPAALTALCITTAALAAGCGGGGALSLDPVASAADKTVNAGAAKVTLTMTFTGQGQTITMPGSGVADLKTGDADITIDVSKLTAQAGNQATGSQMEEISKGGIVYLKIPFKGLPHGKQWVKIDPQQVEKAMGLGSLAQQANDSPGNLVGVLKNAVDEQKLGQETVDGVQTTHYKTTIDTAKLVQAGAAKAQPWMKSMLKDTPKSMNFDVWVDSSSLIRRMTFDMGYGKASGSMTMDFSDFGTPIDVQAPPPDQVVDAVTLLKQLNGAKS